MANSQVVLRQGDANTTPGSRDDLVVGTPVTVLNSNNTGVTSWLWSLTEVPLGSTATIASPTSSITTFTPDVLGTYLVKLIINGGIAQNQVGAAIKTTKLHFRLPAATETKEFNSTYGWALAINSALKTIDDGYTTSAPANTFQQIYNNSSPATLVVNSTNTGLNIKDASSTIGSNILTIDSYNGASTYFGVSSSAATFAVPTNFNNAITVQSIPISTSGATSGQILQYNGTTFLPTTASVGYNLIQNNGSSVAQETTLNLSPRLLASNISSKTFIDFATSGVSAGSYSSANIVVDAYGRITSAADGYNSSKISGNLTTSRVPFADTATSLLDSAAFTFFPNSGYNSQLKLKGGFDGYHATGLIIAPDNDTSNYGAAINLDSSQAALGGANWIINSGNSTSSYNGYFAIKQDGYSPSLLVSPSNNIIIKHSSDTGEGALIVGGRIASLSGGYYFPDATIQTTAANITSKGALLTSTGSGNTQLNAGVDGYVLTADSTQTSGLKWAVGGSGGGSGGGPTIIDTSNLLLTTIGSTNIINYTPSADGDFVVYIYYRVITATTTLTITLNWNDISGPQTSSILTAASTTVGSGTFAPIYITAANTGAIVISATAGTANQAYISASVLALSAANGSGNVVLEKSNTYDQLLTTTSATNVVSYTPTNNNNHTIYIYYRISNATTNVAISLTWTDTAGAQTMTVLSTTAKTVGSYGLSPIYIQAAASNAINVSFTAGTANNVNVSATITQV